MKVAVHILWIMVVSLAATACSALKECKDPELNLPATIEGGSRNDTLTIADVDWWAFYGDEDLREIIRECLENNKRLSIAVSRIEQARNLYRVDKANLFPDITGSIPFNNETNDYYNDKPLRDPELGIKVSVRWEADIWGRLRWARRKSNADFLATVEDERALRMILVADIASAYFRLVALDNELEIVKHTMQTRREGMELARIRFEGGLTNETVYQQSQVEYATAAALVPTLEHNITVTENAINLLLGEYPGREIKRSKVLSNDLPEKVPVGIPSQLLQRRPDVRASELKLRASMADVGVAYADRFPRLVLDLTGGVENDDFPGLLKSPFSYVAETFTTPIFGFGRKKAKYKAAVAAYDVARQSYEQKVLEVFKEVSDAIDNYRSARSAVTLRSDLLDAAKKYDDLTRIQYIAGTILYINVLDAQRRYLEAQIGLSNAIRDEHIALIQLYKALGGGWQVQMQDKEG